MSGGEEREGHGMIDPVPDPHTEPVPGPGADPVPGPEAEPEDAFRPGLDDLEAQLLGEPRSMRRRQVSAGAGISLLSARRFWHALGFPNVQDEDMVFTDADLAALRAVVTLVRDGTFDQDTALAMTRAMGRTADRLAIWQAQLMAEVLEHEPPEPVERRPGEPSRGVPGSAAARAAGEKLTELADTLEPLLVYAWRRHLSAAIARMVADAEPSADHEGVFRVVGFADLVSFTALVRRLSEHQLVQVVQRFEALASEVIAAHGGRVIKTVGDEVLYVTIGTPPAAAIALDLVDAIKEDDILPKVRVGMASGQVVSRLGDVFGTTVNRASRLTAVARPNTVVVDDAVATALSSVSGFEMAQLPPRTLRGLGRITPWRLQRAGASGRRGRSDSGSATTT
ncbi:adenylate/guanylate cyclase domain-containing protein [Segeticoccus rhizosphaerae]|jgi:adenylate cyclase|uniref:adenylate/guanylate cyclase domain-containing protein n=2 Tax=Segeticoccus rhizosphaerae TaxID=1104777 RepID=UPI001EE48EF6|nr:adenylate/guanylate cyclase domain-containing protein [Ornithinicoccus soli]